MKPRNLVCQTPECGHRHELHAKPGINQHDKSRGACLAANGDEDGCACQKFRRAIDLLQGGDGDEQWGDGPGDRPSGQR